MEFASSMAGFALNIIVIIITVLVAGTIVTAAVWAFIRYRRYSQYVIRIVTIDGFGQPKIKLDGGGVFVDPRTKNKRLFLKNANVGLDPDNIPSIPEGRSQVVYLLQSGLKNFTYIRFNVTGNRLIPQVGEEDVNWAVNAYERQKRVFGQSLLLQYMPFIALVFVSVIILILFIYLFKNMSVFKDVAEAMTTAARTIAQNNGGTVILP